MPGYGELQDNRLIPDLVVQHLVSVLIRRKMRNASKNFVAIDFETADQGRDSACAVGLVTVLNGKIVKRESHLIRPPRRTFVFSYIHGIEWSHVEKKPTFAALWPKLKKSLAGVDYLAAHNASFDSETRGVVLARVNFRNQAKQIALEVEGIAQPAEEDKELLETI